MAPDRVTVAEYAERWLKRQKGLNNCTAAGYRRRLGYALEHLGKMRVREVRAPHIKDTMAALAERPMTAGRGKGKPMSACA